MHQLKSREELQRESPSRADGISVEAEQLQLTQTINFLFAMKELKMTSWTLALSGYFCRLFFARRSLVKNDRFLIAAAAVHLAHKATDGYRPLRDIAYVTLKLKHGKKLAEFAPIHKDFMDKTDVLLQPHMDNILVAERALCYALEFRLNLNQPYGNLCSLFVKLGLGGLLDEKTKQLKNFSHVYVLDTCMRTSALLQYNEQKIALTALYAGAKMNKYDLPLEGKSFLEFFANDITEAELLDIQAQTMAALGKAPVLASATTAGLAPVAAAGPPSSTPPLPISLIAGKRAGEGPPLPVFRPIVLTGDQAVTSSILLDNAASAVVGTEVKGSACLPAVSTSAEAPADSKREEVEEGELLPSPSGHAADHSAAPLSATTSSRPPLVLPLQGEEHAAAAAAASATPGPPAAAAGVPAPAAAAPGSPDPRPHSCPGSGEQNNNNDSAGDGGEQVVQGEGGSGGGGLGDGGAGPGQVQPLASSRKRSREASVEGAFHSLATSGADGDVDGQVAQAMTATVASPASGQDGEDHASKALRVE